MRCGEKPDRTTDDRTTGRPNDGTTERRDDRTTGRQNDGTTERRTDRNDGNPD
jgi:hypothetical protein